MFSARALVSAILVTIVVTAGIIYLTPLKHLAIIEPSIHDIDPVAFYEAYRANPSDFIFIDVRSESSYNRLHAQGSVSMPLHTLYDERHSLPKSGKQIVLICSGGRASGVGYSYLQHFGFTNIARIEGGIEQWALAELPTEGVSVDQFNTPETSTFE